MSNAFTRLWHRAPIWRAALLIAFPTTLLSVLYPPHLHRKPVWMSKRLVTPEAELPAPPLTPVDPSFPIPPKPPLHMTSEERTAEFTNGWAPYYYREAPWSPDEMQQQERLAAKEALIAPSFTGTVPFLHREVPLPPGTWTAISLGQEAAVDDRPAATGVLLARLDGHDATGFMLMRSSMPGQPAMAPAANEQCTFPRRYARGVLVPPGSDGEECWYVSRATVPFGSWDLAMAPPVLLLAPKVMKLRGVQYPVCLVGSTYFRSTRQGWIEITYFFDPFANGVREGGPWGGWNPEDDYADDTLHHFVGVLATWTQQVIPLLETLGPQRIPASVLSAVNKDVPG